MTPPNDRAEITSLLELQQGLERLREHPRLSPHEELLVKGVENIVARLLDPPQVDPAWLPGGDGYALLHAETPQLREDDLLDETPLGDLNPDYEDYLGETADEGWR